MKTTETFTVFSRSIASLNDGHAPKRTIYTGLSADDAMSVCREFNDNRTAAQIQRGTKYEFTAEVRS